MLTRSHIRLLLIAVLGALLLLPLLPGTARACSCAQLTITQAMEAGRHPSEAVAIVTRVDDGGDIEGRVEVVEIVSGRLPDAFDVTMDDGGSCQPAIQVGATVGLLVDTAGEEPVARECSLLDQASVLAHLHGPLQPDTDATGPPALAVLGRMRSTDTEPAEPPLREQPSGLGVPLDPPSDAPPAPSSPTPAAPGLPLPTDPPAEPTTTTPPSPPVIPVASEPGGVSATEAVGIVGAALAGLAGMVVVVGRRRVRDGRRPGDG